MRRLIIFSVVVFPHPDGPTSTEISPSGTSRDRLVTATVPSGKRLETESRRIMSRAPDQGPVEGTPGASRVAPHPQPAGRSPRTGRWQGPAAATGAPIA